jgi:hypothetical protein
VPLFSVRVLGDCVHRIAVTEKDRRHRIAHYF